MSKLRLLALASASLVCVTPVRAQAQAYASAVISYNPGSGGAPGYNDPNNALGQPSVATPGFSSTLEPVTPFNPPWPSSQLVSIGTGGSLTVRFEQSIRNAPANPFGLDFIVFGNNGFTISDFDRGITDGSLFTFDPPGSSRVLVSADNLEYFELVVPSGISAAVDGFFPTDGSGDFQTPVDPALTGADFADKDLAGIRALYGGSAGGTGFDLAWARNAHGDTVALDAVDYLRIDVLSGKAEIDGIAIVPEPGLWGLLGLGSLLALITRRRSVLAD
jgi:hypothetical protein